MDSIEKSDLKDLKNFFRNRTKEIKDEKDQVISIIGSHLEKIDDSTLSEIDKKNNKKDLTDLGNFLKSFDDTIIIEEAIRESPDFLVRKGQKTIGVELRDIYRDSDSKKTGIVEKILEEVESELKSLEPETKGVYKINFKENISFGAETRPIKDEIIHCISASELPNKYVTSIDKSSGEALHLYSNETSSAGPLTKGIILEAITQKEKSLSVYKSLPDASEFWLLLVLSGLDESNNNSIVDDSICGGYFDTEFDKVFVFDCIKSNIVELKRE